MLYNICIDNPFPNCEKIYPIQQKKVRELLDSLDYDNVISVKIFGSSVNDQCHVGSDVDVYLELKEQKYPVLRTLHYAYDIWSNFTVDDRLYKEIQKRGVFVYGKEAVR